LEAGKQHSPNIKDVAKKAGVSVATVSAVINRNRFVSDELTRRVLEAIEELNYIPNRVARGLKKKRTFIIAYIIPDITNPIFAEVVRGIQDVMEKVSYSVSLYNSYFSDKKLFRNLAAVLESKPDGIILSAWHSPEVEKAVSLIQESGTPLVIAHSPRNMENIDSILVDDEEGAYDAVNTLIKWEHKHIVSLGVENSTTSLLRERGYRKALLEKRGIVEEDLIFRAKSFSSKSAFDKIQELDNSDPNFTAIFAHSDSLAVGAIEALQEMGLRVPENVSVMGFDGAYAFCTVPKITTMVIPNYEIGNKVAEILLERINLPHSGSVIKEEIKPHLVVQKSTRCLDKD